MDLPRNDVNSYRFRDAMLTVTAKKDISNMDFKTLCSKML